MTSLAFLSKTSSLRQGAGQINVGAAVASPVYITADDGTSSLSLRQLTESTKFNLTFTTMLAAAPCPEFSAATVKALREAPGLATVLRG